MMEKMHLQKTRTSLCWFCIVYGVCPAMSHICIPQLFAEGPARLVMGTAVPCCMSEQWWLIRFVWWKSRCYPWIPRKTMQILWPLSQWWRIQNRNLSVFETEMESIRQTIMVQVKCWLYWTKWKTDESVLWEEAEQEMWVRFIMMIIVPIWEPCSWLWWMLTYHSAAKLCVEAIIAPHHEWVLGWLIIHLPGTQGSPRTYNFVNTKTRRIWWKA